jgi:arabinofuranosyltransferase
VFARSSVEQGVRHVPAAGTDRAGLVSTHIGNSSASSPTGRRYLPSLILTVFFGFAVAYGQYLYAPCDDAYIFYTYAANFVEGNGLTFNGAHVEGFTSVLWVVLLSVAGFSGLPLPVLAEALSISTGLFALLATYHLGRRLSLDSRWALLPAALLAATGDFAFYMSVGLEQILFTALVAVCVSRGLGNPARSVLQSKGFPFLLAIMILARPEGALIAALLLVVLCARSRSLWLPTRCGLVLTLMLAPIFVLRRVHYGYWLPNTYYAKAPGGLEMADQGLRYLLRVQPLYTGIVLAAGLLLGLALYRRDWSRLIEVSPLWFITIVWIAYLWVSGGDDFVGGRFLLPILPLVYVALARLATSMPLAAAGWGTAVLCAILVASHVRNPTVNAQALLWRYGFDRRHKVGVYLREHFPPDTLVAVNPAGVIPYYSGLPTIDMLGLNDTFIAHNEKRNRSLPHGHHAGDGAYVLSRQPDIILLGDSTAKPLRYISDQEIWADPTFHADYELTEWPGIGHAYVRKDAARPTADDSPADSRRR